MNQRPRDSQRSKLYAAEREVFGAPASVGAEAVRLLPGIHDCQVFVGRILRSAWWEKHSASPVLGRIGAVEIQDGRGKRRAKARPSEQLIILPRDMRRPWVILHELAHLVVNRDTRLAWHGREFAALYLKMVRRFLGAEAERALKAAFKRQGVRYSPRRRLSDEALERLRAAVKERFAKASEP